MTPSRVLKFALVTVVVVFGLIQLVPYGHQHAAPAAGQAVAWDSPRTLELARRACFDCHTNETTWPWYSSIAPISWRIQGHVDGGRRKLNFTAFDPTNRKMVHAAKEAPEEIEKGDMPLSDYLLLHPRAHLSAAEKQELIAGLKATFAAFAEHGKGGPAGARDSASGGAAAGEGDERGGRDRDGDRD